jgi:predicted nucleotidyltransferase
VWFPSLLLLALSSPAARAQQPSPPAAQQPAPAPAPAAEPAPAAPQPGSVLDAVPPPEKPTVSSREEYVKALERLVNGKGGTVEKVYALAQAAAREHLQATLEWDQTLAQGKIPRKRFERQLPGFHVGISPAIYVIADSSAFLELARQRGTAVDRRFFELLHQTFKGTATRVYVDQLDEMSACYQVGSREMLSLYKAWTQFQASYPNAYKDTVKDELTHLEQVYTSATCACSSHEVVDAGLEAFLKEFPKARIAPQVRERVNKIHTRNSDIIFRCGQELNLPQPVPPGVGPPTTP